MGADAAADMNIPDAGVGFIAPAKKQQQPVQQQEEEEEVEQKPQRELVAA